MGGPAQGEARRNLDTVDLEHEIASIVDLSSQLDGINRAENEAGKRLTKVQSALAEAAAPYGIRLADALIGTNYETVSRELATPSKATLEAERATIRDAQRELAHRAQDTRRAIDEVRRAVRHRFGEAAKPLTDAIEVEAGRLAEELGQCLAALQSLHDAFDRHSPMIQPLSEMMVVANNGGRVTKRASDGIDVPGVILELLESLADHHPAANILVKRTIIPRR